MNFKKMLMQLKVYLDRGRAYANIFSFAGTIFLVIAQLKALGFGIDLSKYTIPILIIGFLGIIFVGYIEDKLNLFSTELDLRSWKNPVIKKQFDTYDVINAKLDRIEKKLGDVDCTQN